MDTYNFRQEKVFMKVKYVKISLQSTAVNGKSAGDLPAVFICGEYCAYVDTRWPSTGLRSRCNTYLDTTHTTSQKYQETSGDYQIVYGFIQYTLHSLNAPNPL